MANEVGTPSATITPSVVPSQSSKVGAGAAGAGTGTLLVLLANNLPNTGLKSWLVLIAPAVSVAVSVLYSWTRVAVENHLNKRELAQAIEQAKQTLKDALGNPNTSEEHRKQLQRELEALELLLVQTEVNRIRLLTNGRPTTASPQRV